MRKLFLLTLLAFLSVQAFSQTETVQGNVQNPDGSPFTGEYVISLTRSSVVNVCVSPAQVIPFPGLVVNVVHGVFTPTQMIPTVCLSPSLPYYVRLRDSHGKQIYSDNWYIPQMFGGSVNVGTLGTVQLAAGILVSVPQAIISTPSGSQTITQQAGTNLIVNNLLVSNLLTYQGNYTLQSSAAATVGSPVSSPVLTIGGNTWNGSASVPSPWTIQDVERFSFGSYGSVLTFTYGGSGPLSSVVIGSDLLVNANIVANKISIAGGTITWSSNSGSPSGSCSVGSIYTSSAGTTTNLFWVCGSTGWILVL